MSYRTILVHLDSIETSADLIAVSTTLAQKHNAHLIAMYVTPMPQVYISSDLPAPVGLVEQHDNFHRKRCDDLKQLFEEATATADFVSEWRDVNAHTLSVAATVTDVARTVDVVVMGQISDPSEVYASTVVPEDVILACARPVIVVPVQKALPESIRNIFVAWDGREQAVRALFDALPLLREADNVRIHTINAKLSGGYRILTSTGELANTLSRHGVNVTLSESEAHAGDVGDEILQYANDSGADLLVMGAYGHTRLREYVFGGVTRKILHEMPIPVLMSH